MRGTWTNKGLQLIVDHWVASGTFPVGLALFKNDYTPTRFSQATDFDHADFTGYVRGSLTNGAGLKNDQADGAYLRLWAVAFAANNPSTQNVIYGLYATDNSGSHPVLFAARFDEPFHVPVAMHTNFYVNVALGVSPVEV